MQGLLCIAERCTRRYRNISFLGGRLWHVCGNTGYSRTHVASFGLLVEGLTCMLNRIASKNANPYEELAQKEIMRFLAAPLSAVLVSSDMCTAVSKPDWQYTAKM